MAKKKTNRTLGSDWIKVGHNDNIVFHPASAHFKITGDKSFDGRFFTSLADAQTAVERKEREKAATERERCGLPVFTQTSKGALTAMMLTGVNFANGRLLIKRPKGFPKPQYSNEKFFFDTAAGRAAFTACERARDAADKARNLLDTFEVKTNWSGPNRYSTAIDDGSGHTAAVKKLHAKARKLGAV